MAEKGLFTYDTLVQATAGVAGSVSAQLLTMPLTTCFTRAQLEKGKTGKGPIQILRTILADEGLQGVYRGCVSTCQCVAVSNFVYFYTFHGIKGTINVTKQSPLKDLMIACLAGSVNVLSTNPIWVVNARMKMAGDRYRNLVQGLLDIFKHEGIASLWNGARASLILVSNPAIKFTVYEFLKKRLLELRRTNKLTASAAFMLGVMSSAVATTVTYPLQMIQAKQRFESSRKTFLEVLQQILRSEGPAGLYRGMDSKLLQSVIAAGFMFFTYEKISVFIFNILGRKKIA